jgi:uncharacterized membrane protein
MNSKTVTRITALALFVALAIPVQLAAQEHKKEHHHYKLFDMGTFGGPGSGILNQSSPVLNGRGALVGVSDTSITDPYYPDCFLDCYVDYGWVWQNGVLTQLSSLPGGASNFPGSINNHGQITGVSQNGAIDSLTGWPQADAVIWQGGQITDLGTLGGNQSSANANNNRGQVVGAALNTTLDPFANSPLCSGCGTFAQTFLFIPAATEVRAFRWTRDQGMQDLGTLGGPDSNAWIINDRGQIAGESFTSFTPNPSTGVPTIDPFVWEKGKGMTDLGGLGGTFGFPTWLNSRGEVVGNSNLPGDMSFHAFLWSRSGGMQDLPTLGGTFSFANWVNDAGVVVGGATPSGDQVQFAVFWKDGVITRLETIAGDDFSHAISINSQEQIVGTSCCGTIPGGVTGVLWENGERGADLNTLLLPGTTMLVTEALIINDGGEIGCLGLDGGIFERACVLIPCDERHPGVEGCDYSMVDESTATQSLAPRYGPSGTQRPPQSRRTNRYRIPGRGTGPTN